MQASFALGMVGFGAFLLMEFTDGMTSAIEGIPAIRGAITLIFAAALATTYFNRTFVIRHYTPIINFFSSLGMLELRWSRSPFMGTVPAQTFIGA